MSIIKPSTPSGWSVFCDDVRREENGKWFFIGVYEAEMLISPSFPASLPTFAVVIKYFERFNESDKPVKFAVTVPGMEEPVFSHQMDRNALISPPEGETELENKRVSFISIAQFRNFQIPQPGAISVRAYRGDDEIHLGSLGVKLNPAVASPPPEPPPHAPPQTERARRMRKKRN